MQCRTNDGKLGFVVYVCLISNVRLCNLFVVFECCLFTFGLVQLTVELGRCFQVQTWMRKGTWRLLAFEKNEIHAEQKNNILCMKRGKRVIIPPLKKSKQKNHGSSVLLPSFQNDGSGDARVSRRGHRSRPTAIG